MMCATLAIKLRDYLGRCPDAFSITIGNALSTKCQCEYPSTVALPIEAHQGPRGGQGCEQIDGSLLGYTLPVGGLQGQVQGSYHQMTRQRFRAQDGERHLTNPEKRMALLKPKASHTVPKVRTTCEP